MNKFINSIFVASITLSTYSAFAGDKSNTKDSMEGLTQDQTMEQSMGSSTKAGRKNMDHSNLKSSKMMDTNADGMVSKDEFMKHHEMKYSKMKQTNGNVSIKDMDAEMNIGTTKGNKLQPSDTKNAPPEARS